jgi:hypothetical protein
VHRSHISYILVKMSFNVTNIDANTGTGPGGEGEGIAMPPAAGLQAMSLSDDQQEPASSTSADADAAATGGEQGDGSEGTSEGPVVVLVIGMAGVGKTVRQ